MKKRKNLHFNRTDPSVFSGWSKIRNTVYLWRSIRLLPLSNGLRIQWPETDELKSSFLIPSFFWPFQNDLLWILMRVSVASLLDSWTGISDINVCVWESSNGSQIQHASYQFSRHVQHGLCLPLWKSQKNYLELSQEVKLMNTV